ncbi:MAG: hypothetical protein LC791_00545, partial [Acidobacteria bacterium]|nr:hypothetical protein [Acidobacteriota bacterium]
FYIPAILLELEPGLFPRDSALLQPQARYFMVDEILATLMRQIGGSIEQWFLAGYVLSLLILYGALLSLGLKVFRSPLAVAALIAAATLRHRIAKTGVNTLEGYFHPRVLVFAIGVTAIALYLRGRPWGALILVACGAAVHPSTAAFFLLLLGVATWWTDPRARPLLAACATVVGLLATWMLFAGPWRGALAPMDAEWRTLLSTKDYLFPLDDWGIGVWAINLGTAILACAGLHARLRAGDANARERGLLAGALFLLAAFLVTTPLVAMGSALLVQLQISRVFWVLELLALLAVIWWFVDRPAARPDRRWMAAAVVGVLVVGSFARGVWVGGVERERNVFQPTLPATEWTAVLRWLATHTPQNANILANPGHAWRYGVPVRLTGRDVYLEDVKDTAMALYSRDVAQRVIRRTRDLGDFDALTADRARDLATQYDLDYLISTAKLDLTLLASQGRFHIYRLR